MRPEVEVEVNLFWLAAVLWAVFFWGDPDLHDALIHWLMQP